jgi:hypothetical protein
MKIYLDNCCFNRPFDDQNQLRIRLEAEAKLAIQDGIRSGTFGLIWSYILDYENVKNPFPERRMQIGKWRGYAREDIAADDNVLALANGFAATGMKKMDALHLACAKRANADYFLTTDDGILKKAVLIIGMQIRDPIGFIKEAFP